MASPLTGRFRAPPRRAAGTCHTDVAFAQRVVTAYDDALVRGLGACTVDGKMVDLPVVRWARKILARAAVGGT